MRTFFLYHDDWSQWIKADIAASGYPFDGFLVIRRTRAWWGAYLWKRAKRRGWFKVLDRRVVQQLRAEPSLDKYEDPPFETRREK